MDAKAHYKAQVTFFVKKIFYNNIFPKFVRLFVRVPDTMDYLFMLLLCELFQSTHQR